MSSNEESVSVICATIISKLEKGKRTKLNDNDSSDSEVLGKEGGG